MAEIPDFDPAPQFQVSPQQWGLIKAGETRSLSLAIHALIKAVGPDRQDEVVELERRMLEDARNMPIRGVPMDDEKLVVDMLTAGIMTAFKIARGELR